MEHWDITTLLDLMRKKYRVQGLIEGAKNGEGRGIDESTFNLVLSIFMHNN